MTALLASAFVASLLGSLHCAGMCGPFAAFWSGADGTGARQRAAAGAAYHLSRLATYASLGALAGLLGGAVEAAAAGRIRSAAALVAGLLLVAWGAVGMLRHFGAGLPSLPAPARVKNALSRATLALRGRPPVQRAAAIGLLTTLLPCGWLHAFVLAAAGTGSAGRGALLMTAFWAGTVPILAALGAGALAVLGPLKRHAPAISAAAVLLAGVVALVHHARAIASPEPCHDPNAAVTRGILAGTGR